MSNVKVLFYISECLICVVHSYRELFYTIKWINVAHYLTISLRDPVLTFKGRSPAFYGWTVHQNGPLIFVILRSTKHYPHLYLNTYIKKMSGQISGGLNLVKLVCSPIDFQNHPRGVSFSKMVLNFRVLEIIFEVKF